MHNLLVSDGSERIRKVINCKDYSSVHRLLRVTDLVFRFTLLLKERIHMQSSTVLSDIDRSRAMWIREIQEMLPSNPHFSSWQHQFGLYLDESQIWRCKGRLSNSSLPSHTKYPILLDKGPYLPDRSGCPQNNVFSIMELRRHCPRFEGGHFKGKPSPLLPDCRVTQTRPF